MILQRVSPVTHSIGNSVKRVVVIASSILVFRNPVTQQASRAAGLAVGSPQGWPGPYRRNACAGMSSSAAHVLPAHLSCPVF